jgi:hypothetical protein
VRETPIWQQNTKTLSAQVANVLKERPQILPLLGLIKRSVDLSNSVWLIYFPLYVQLSLPTFPVSTLG